MRRKNVIAGMKVEVNGFDFKNIVFRQKQIIDDFCYDCIENPDGKKVYRVVDPVHMLLNQERLESTLGNTAAKNFVDSFRNQKTDPFTELRAQCSDDDLMFMIKSRHLQAPAEILAWTHHMKQNMEYFTSEVQKLVSAKQQQETNKVANTSEETKTD